MNWYAKYACTYKLPKYHGIGFCNNDVYFHINSAGLYDTNVPVCITNRTSGRNDYYLSYNYSGTINVRLNGKTEKVNDGQILIFRPKEPQNYWYGNHKHTKIYWLHFTGYGVEEMLSAAGLDDGHIYTIGIVPQIANYIESIIDELTNKKTGYELMVMSTFTALLAIISRILKEDQPSKVRDRNARIYETLSYIRNNVSEKISVAELARSCFLSTNRYSTVFKELIGISPQQYIMQCKMQKALEYMRYTDMNICEIAAELGFSDQLYFSRWFRKHMRTSPTQFMYKYYRS